MMKYRGERVGRFEAGGAYPNADYCASRGICLPTHGGLTDADIERVCTMLGLIVRP